VVEVEAAGPGRSLVSFRSLFLGLGLLAGASSAGDIFNTSGLAGMTRRTGVGIGDGPTGSVTVFSIQYSVFRMQALVAETRRHVQFSQPDGNCMGQRRTWHNEARTGGYKHMYGSLIFGPVCACTHTHTHMHI